MSAPHDPNRKYAAPKNLVQGLAAVIKMAGEAKRMSGLIESDRHRLEALVIMYEIAISCDMANKIMPGHDHEVECLQHMCEQLELAFSHATLAEHFKGGKGREARRVFEAHAKLHGANMLNFLRHINEHYKTVVSDKLLAQCEAHEAAAQKSGWKEEEQECAHDHPHVDVFFVDLNKPPDSTPDKSRFDDGSCGKN